jgi:aldehyde:ferredoxin oxidoreductase
MKFKSKTLSKKTLKKTNLSCIDCVIKCMSSMAGGNARLSGDALKLRIADYQIEAGFAAPPCDITLRSMNE